MSDQAIQSDDTVVTPDEVSPPVDAEQSIDPVEQLQSELQLSRAREQRLLADYQNLIRRNREEQSRWAKLANKELVASLLLPLEHLSRAAEQVNDTGLNMVVQQFWQTLEGQGLVRMQTVGTQFDERTMEAVEQKSDGLTVQSEVRPGFTLNGEVIQHAKVSLGADGVDQKKTKKN